MLVGGGGEVIEILEIKNVIKKKLNSDSSLRKTHTSKLEDRAEEISQTTTEKDKKRS